MYDCPICHGLATPSGSGRPRRSHLHCAICGEPMFRGRSSRPQGEAVCHPCRRVTSQRDRTPCIDCAEPSLGRRCRTCSARARRIRSAGDTRVQRWSRERDAPGLSQKARYRLLAQWKRQCRSCAYCPSLATTVDHVIPLVRGGTNHEGNLVPCCRRCNSSKAARLISEWRHGRQAAPMVTLPEWANTVPVVRKPRVKRWADMLLFNVCPCGSLIEGKGQWCSNRCWSRITYRRRHGIPDTAPLYSSRRVA